MHFRLARQLALRAGRQRYAGSKPWTQELGGLGRRDRDGFPEDEISDALEGRIVCGDIFDLVASHEGKVDRIVGEEAEFLLDGVTFENVVGVK